MSWFFSRCSPSKDEPKDEVTNLPRKDMPFLKIPTALLSTDDTWKQKEMLKNYDDSEEKKSDNNNPSNSESLRVLEVVFWTVLFELAKKSFPYYILMEAFKNGNSKDAKEILNCNSGFLKVMEEAAKTKLDIIKRLPWIYGSPSLSIEGTVNIDLKWEPEKTPKNDEQIDRTTTNTDTLFRVPRDSLSSEDLNVEMDFLKRNAEKEKKKKSPTRIEKTKTREVVFWTCLFKLAEKSFPYYILKRAIENGDFQSINNMLNYNSNFLDTIKAMDEKAKKFKVKKVFANNKPEFLFEQQVNIDLKYSPAIGTDQKISPSEDRDKDVENEDSITSQEYEKLEKEETLNHEESVENAVDSDRNLDPKEVVKAESVLVAADDGEGNDSVDDNEKKEFSEPITHQKSENTLQNYDDQVAEILKGMNTSAPPKPPKKESSNDKRNSKKELEEYRKMMEKMTEYDKKEEEKMRQKAKKETEKMLEDHRKYMKEIEELAREREALENQKEQEAKEQMNQKYREKMEKLNRKYDEKKRKLREERERIERETEEEMHRFVEEFHAQTAAFLKCIALKLKWEDEEKKWSDWLNKVKEPVIKAKVQVLYFQEIGMEMDEEDVKMKLSQLHRQTVAAHQLLYDAFFFLKVLANEHSDRVFLRILMKNIGRASDKLFVASRNLRKLDINEDTYDRVKAIFDSFDSSDIMSTWQLRNVAKTANSKDYENIADPWKEDESAKVPEANCKIEEVVDTDKDVSSECSATGHAPDAPDTSTARRETHV